MRTLSAKVMRIAPTIMLCVGLGIGGGALAAPLQDPKQDPKQETKPGAAPAGQAGQAQQPPYTAEEYAAFQKIQPLTDPKAKAEAAEEFLKKYPNSTLAMHAHLAALTPYQMLNNADKVIEHGEAIMAAIKPGDPQGVGVSIQTLTTLAYVYAERQGSNPTYKEKALQSAQKAVEQLNGLPKPEQMSDAQWNEAKKQILGTNYSTQGLVYLSYAVEAKDKDEKNKQLAKAAEVLQKALEVNKKDDPSWYRLGLVYTEQNKGEEAVKALAKAVALEGPSKQFAQRDLEKVYKALHKNSTEGLDDVIKKAREELK